jgi:hypothetical protein
MNRHIIDCLLIVVLLSCSAALAQDVLGPQIAPSGMQSMSAPNTTQPPPVPSPAGQPVPPPPPPGIAPPPGQSSWPPPAPPAYQQPAPYVPPDQPVYQPVYQQPYAVAPAQPVYEQPGSWLATTSPSLGLAPGATNPHWDISIDALWLSRDVGDSIALGHTEFNPDAHTRQAIRTDSLWSDDVVFPLEPGVRLQLVGRITDRMAIEATCWGLQDWSVGRSIHGDPVGESVLGYSSWLQTPIIDNVLSYTYSSQVANAEINQRFKLWSQDPYRALSWLWGVRYFHLNEDFALSGSDVCTGASETLDWQTKNDLVGMQVGLNWTCGADRFQLCTEAKVGLFANIYSQHGVDTGVGTAGFEPFDVTHNNTDLAALFELSVMLRCRVTSCLWLRGGFQYYGLSGLAIAPRQLGGFDANGTAGFSGLSLGMELTR